MLQNDFHISLEATERVNAAQESLCSIFHGFEQTSLDNQGKILRSFLDNRLESRHFLGSTGYGYDDIGREKLDAVYADVFRGEMALVRPHIVSATHALSLSLFGLLRPGDGLLNISGTIYDTLKSTIGLTNAPGSLKEYGVSYYQTELKQGKIDLAAVGEVLSGNNHIRVVYIQRSRGYEWRSALSLEEIRRAIHAIRKIRSDVFVVVDNCYGEFVGIEEPLECGADVIVGSLIKNPGGGLAPTGAYIVGKKQPVKQISYRLTCPGIGAEIGSYQPGYLPFFQGLFLAPRVVCDSLKGAALLAKCFEDLGYEINPASSEHRSDIIQSIKFQNKQQLIGFCQSVQAVSPVDGHVVPEPWAMPGYQDEVIMAAGTFIQGASIELCSDAPIRPPYIGYWQGGLTYEHCKIAVMKILSNLLEKQSE